MSTGHSCREIMLLSIQPGHSMLKHDQKDIFRSHFRKSLSPDYAKIIYIQLVHNVVVSYSARSFYVEARAEGHFQKSFSEIVISRLC
jgi:hypothetical protein